MKRIAVLLLLSGVAATVVATSRASAPPVGPLPRGPVTTVTAPNQEYVSVALNRGQSGLVWRVARAWNTRVVVQTTEANLGDLTVYVFRTIKPGTATLRFALTNGERPKAYRAATYKLTVIHR
jgi:hypothetical protein